MPRTQPTPPHPASGSEKGICQHPHHRSNGKQLKNVQTAPGMRGEGRGGEDDREEIEANGWGSLAQA